MKAALITLSLIATQTSFAVTDGELDYREERSAARRLELIERKALLQEKLRTCIEEKAEAALGQYPGLQVVSLKNRKSHLMGHGMPLLPSYSVSYDVQLKLSEGHSLVCKFHHYLADSEILGDCRDERTSKFVPLENNGYPYVKFDQQCVSNTTIIFEM